MERREFLKIGLGAIGAGALYGCTTPQKQTSVATTQFAPDGSTTLAEWERPRVLRGAQKWIGANATAVTDFPAPRSPGGPHDYYSEADYAWADPKNPNGPYIGRDGYSNPDNFNTHRHAMIRLSIIVGFMGAAYKLTHDDQYAREAARHLRKWFINPDTRMNANLRFSQRGRNKDLGNRIGIIDTVHLAEVAKALIAFENSPAFSDADRAALRDWFSEYLSWLNTSPMGIQERDCLNNHATCWILQAAAFAEYLGNTAVIDQCRNLLLQKMGPAQLAADGSFPLELKRTKPYCYSLFNLNVMGMCAQQLATPTGIGRGLWTVRNSLGGSIQKSLAYHYPYIDDKSKWPFPHDVMYYDFWPVQFPVLLFGGWALNEPRYIQLWKRLDPDPTNQEVIRNMPVRQPILWGEGTV